MKQAKPFVVGAAAALVLGALAACSPPGGAEADRKGSNVATGSTITIGAMSPSDGASAYPEVEQGVEAAAWYVNNELGGINGHKLEVDVCKGDGSPETAVACANGFVDKKYPVVVDSYDQSFGGAKPILVDAGIPYVGTVSGDPANEAVKYGQGFFWTGSLAVTAGGMANIWDQQGTKKVHLAVADLASGHTYIDGVFKPMAKALGVDADVQYVDPAKANWNAVASAEASTDPDMVGSISMTEDGCTGLFSALRKQGWDGDIFVGSCSKYVEDMNPADAAGTLTIPRTWIYPAKEHAPAEVADQLEAFADAMDAVGAGDALEARAIYGFTSVVTLVQILNEAKVDDVAPESVVDAIKQVKDFPMFLGPKITCDGKQWPGHSSACSNQSIYFEVQEDGSYQPGTESGYAPIPDVVVDALS